MSITYDIKMYENEKFGWSYYEILAFYNDIFVGYILIKNLTESNFYRFYPTIFDYLSKIEQRFDIGNVDSKNITYESIDNINYLLNQISDLTLESNISKPEALMLIDEIKDSLEKSLDGVNYHEFFDAYVNKPFVDYVYVYPEYRGMRIGKSLYVKASKFLKLMGLNIHASTIQTEDSKKVWESFARSGYVEDTTLKA